MRDVPFDVVAIRPHQGGERHGRVVDPQVEALSEQMLRQLDERALAQVVGAGLEREAEQPDATSAACHDHVDGSSQMPLVGAQDAVEQR